MNPEAPETNLVPVESTNVEMGFFSRDGLALMHKAATMLASSALIPEQFRGNVPNVIIALEMAQRMHASPLAVMQNLYIVHGKPGWSASFIIAAINSTGKFSPLRFKTAGEGDNNTCVAWARELGTGEILESPPVSIGTAKKEGWYSKNGSKWQTMPELMLRYRTATLFGRLYAPEVLMGMRAAEEIEDVEVIDVTGAPEVVIPEGGSKADKLAAILGAKQEAAAPPPEPPAETDEELALNAAEIGEQLGMKPATVTRDIADAGRGGGLRQLRDGWAKALKAKGGV